MSTGSEWSIRRKPCANTTTPLPFPKRCLVFQRLEQVRAAALDRSSTISTDSHQHDQLARGQPADSMQHQGGLCAVIAQLLLGQAHQQALAQAWVVAEFQSFEWSTVNGFRPYMPHEHGRGRSG